MVSVSCGLQPLRPSHWQQTGQVAIKGGRIYTSSVRVPSPSPFLVCVVPWSFLEISSKKEAHRELFGTHGLDASPRLICAGRLAFPML